MSRQLSLPYFQSQSKEMSLLQTNWRSIIDPVLKNPMCNGLFIDAQLVTGANTINHKLGRSPQGYVVTDQDASANFFRSQPFNNLTLVLTSSANVNVSIYVF